MGGRFQISRRKRQCVSAIIASIVTTIVAMTAISSADAQTCTLRDVDAWHSALNDPDMEHSPDYILEVTETFIRACPMRPERFEAHRTAAMAAADQGDVTTAVQHFRDAGRMTSLLANFYAISVYATAGDHRTAWRVRDQMVEAWRSRLERDPTLSVSAIPHRKGMIYEISFGDGDLSNGSQKTWVAVPFGPGWPASLSLSSDEFRASLRAEVSSSDSLVPTFYDLNRCDGRSNLDIVSSAIPGEDFNDHALRTLTRYLANPDRPTTRSKHIELCVWPSRLLPSPKRPAF